MTDKSTKKLAKMVMAWFCALLLTWMPYWSPIAAASEAAAPSSAAVEAAASEVAAAEAEIEFTDDWQEILTGDLVPGGTFKVSYDSQRLNCNRDTRYGQPAWSIYAYAQFAEDAEPENIVLEPFAEEGILTGEFDIPSDAQQVEMWFYNWGYYTGFSNPNCYDSEYGANYHFPLS